MTVIIYTVMSLVCAVSAGGNLSIVTSRSGTWINWAASVAGVAAATYFAARSHGWSL